MEKIICNVLYKPTLFLMMKGGLCPNYVLGTFAEKEDAVYSIKLIFSIFKDFEKEFNLMTYGSYRIDKVVKPESYTEYYNNLNEFIKDDEYVKFFIEHKGLNELENRIKELRCSDEIENKDIVGNEEKSL